MKTNKVNVSGDRKCYKAGIIGCGHAAFNTSIDECHQHWISPASPITHVGALTSLSQIQFKAVCDVNSRIADEKAASYGIKAYADYRKMIEDEDLDIVTVATPVKTHYEIMKALAETRVKGIFCEKPVTSNVREAKHLIDIFSKCRKPVAVNLFRNYDPVHNSMKEMIKQDAIGKVDSIFALWEEGGLQEVGTHPIGLANYVLESSARRVFAKTDSRMSPGQDAAGTIIIEYENGVEAVVWVPKPGVHHMDEIKIIGSRGYMRLGKYVAEYCKWDPYAGKDVYMIPAVRPLPIRSFGMSPMQHAILSLIHSIETGEDVGSGIREATDVLEIVIAAFISSQEKRWIDLPLSHSYYEESIY